MSLAAQQAEIPAMRPLARPRRIQQPRPRLHPQDPAHGIVKARDRNHTFPHLPQQVSGEVLPAVRRHVHVQPGNNRIRAVGLAASRQLPVPVPVADHHAVEIPVPFQEARQQVLASVHFLPLPSGEGRHHALQPRLKRRGIGDGVNVAHVPLRNDGLALIASFLGRPVADKVLRRRHDMVRPEETRLSGPSLKAPHKRRAEPGDQFR